jgi:signal transduction histidine kinase
VASIDVERVERAIGHLVQNGIEAASSSGAAGHRGTVVVRVVDAEAQPGIDVEDDGPGLPRDNLPIFEPFYTTKPQGTGLGLAIAKRAIEDHSGELTCASANGRTVFSVRLAPDRTRHLG